jgi:hypothetical protein
VIGRVFGDQYKEPVGAHAYNLGNRLPRRIKDRPMTAEQPRPTLPPVCAAQQANDCWLTDVQNGLLAYYLTSLLAILGVVFGHDFIKPAPHALTKRSDDLAAFANWDGEWYLKILDVGYSYDPEHPSSVAFFPHSHCWADGWPMPRVCVRTPHCSSSRI